MDNDSATSAAAAGVMGGIILVGVIITIALIVFFVWLFWRIFAKAGYNGAMGLLCLVPYVGPLICMCILAFGTWPIEQQLAYQQAGATPPPAAPPLGGVPMTPPPA